MRLHAVLALLAAAAPLRSATTPAEDLAERKTSIEKIYTSYARIYSEPLNKANSFMTGAHNFAPSASRGKWKVEATVGGGRATTVVDKSSAYAQTNIDQAYKDSIKSLPDSFDIPMLVLDAHLGLPPFLFYDSAEVGLRINSLPGGENFRLTVVGLELRGNVLTQGPDTWLNAMAGLSIDNNNSRMDGKSGDIVVNETFSDGITTFKRTGVKQQRTSFDMQNTAVTVRGVLGHDFLPHRSFLLRPYLGAGAQINSGITEVRIADTGTITSTGPSPATTSAVSQERIEGKDTQPVPGVDLRLGVGLELGLGKFYAVYGFEYGAISGGTAGNLRLGVAF